MLYQLLRNAVVRARPGAEPNMLLKPFERAVATVSVTQGWSRCSALLLVNHFKDQRPCFVYNEVPREHSAICLRTLVVKSRHTTWGVGAGGPVGPSRLLRQTSLFVVSLHRDVDEARKRATYRRTRRLPRRVTAMHLHRLRHRLGRQLCERLRQVPPTAAAGAG